MLRTVPAAEQEAWMNRYCTGQSLGLWEIALYGLMRVPKILTTSFPEILATCR